MDTQILENIGLTPIEIKVLLALLELGSSSAGEVMEKTGLQNTAVHRAFHSLAGKGIITYTFTGKQKHYQAIDPKLLITYLDEKREQLQELIPELIKKSELAKNKPVVTVFQGARGAKELMYLMLDTDSKTYNAYGGNQANVDLFGEFFWKNFHKKRYKKGISARLIFHESLRNWLPILNKYPLTKVRTTKHIFEQLTETVICGNKVAILVYLPKPFGVLIESQAAADSYKQFFDILWKA